MNENNYISNTDIHTDNDLSLGNETDVNETDMENVAATSSGTVAATSRGRENIIKLFIVIMKIFIILIMFISFAMNVNAEENSVYVDSNYMTSQFGNYKYYAIVTDGSGNYATIYTNGKMISTGTTIHSLMTYDEYGFKTMKLEDDYLVIDENGKSYNGVSSVTVQLNSMNIGFTPSINQFIWSNVDIYKTVFSNTGSPSASDEIIYSTANNIGAKPVEPVEPEQQQPSFNDENIVNGLTTLNDVLIAKLDIVITLLIVMITISMFKGIRRMPNKMIPKKEK